MVLQKPINIVADIVSLDRFVTPHKKKLQLLDRVVESQSRVKDEKLKRVFSSGKYNIGRLIAKAKKTCEAKRLNKLATLSPNFRKQDSHVSHHREEDTDMKRPMNKLVFVNEVRRLIKIQREKRLVAGELDPKQARLVKKDDASDLDDSATSQKFKKSKFKWHIKRAKEEAKEKELFTDMRIETKKLLLEKMLKSKALQTQNLDLILGTSRRAPKAKKRHEE